jgi:hypothetical protein
VKKLAAKAASKAALLHARPPSKAPAGAMEFDFGTSTTMTLAKSQISKVIGSSGGSGGSLRGSVGTEGGGGLGSGSGAGGIPLPSAKKRNSLLVSKLAEEKEAEDERKKKLQKQQRHLAEMAAHDAVGELYKR